MGACRAISSKTTNNQKTFSSFMYNKNNTARNPIPSSNT
jgi:hypothetical protein